MRKPVCSWGSRFSPRISPPALAGGDVADARNLRPPSKLTNMDTYLIIGMGPAGVAAGEAIRAQHPNAKIILIGAEPEGYYSRPGLAYYLSGELPEKGLYPFTDDDFRRLKFQRVFGRVEDIHPQAHQVELHDGRIFSYDRLLVATGARARTVDVPGSSLRGVVILDTLKGTRRIVKLARRARTAVVIGGGITALELVEGLRARGVKTHYFLRRDRYWANVLDESESRIVEHRLQEGGVRIHYHTELAEISGKREKVSGVITKKGERIKCQLVAIAIGIMPRIDLALKAGLATDRGVLVNEFLETSSPDVFAAGDVAQVYDPLTGQTVVDSLWGPAREQGHTAGLNMAGIATPYHKGVPFNVTRLAGLTTTIIGTVGRGADADLVGIARGDSETWRQLPDAIAAQANFDVNHLRIMVGKDHLIGALVMGDQTLSQPLRRLIEQKAVIRPIREDLLQAKENLGTLIADFWCHWRQQHGTTA